MLRDWLAFSSDLSGKLGGINWRDERRLGSCVWGIAGVRAELGRRSLFCAKFTSYDRVDVADGAAQRLVSTQQRLCRVVARESAGTTQGH